MYRILTLCCLIGLSLGRQPDAPHHSADHLPDTAFSCRDKVLGGYYADPDAQCQMFHVCVKVAGVGIQDFRFLCPNGTAFDQEAQICAGWGDVACEPTALYYSSDNFDLYRIGSGFESKKAPHVSEEEQDFHLQRAEPDILSGAHSSNFFNNREGKDIDDPRPSVQNRNQVDQSQKRKVVKKLQRRPVETAQTFSTTTQRLFTNNFAGSFVPTTSHPQVSSTFVSSQTSQYNPTIEQQKANHYQQQQTKQTYEPPKSTVDQQKSNNYQQSQTKQTYDSPKPAIEQQKSTYYHQQQTKQTYESSNPTPAPIEVKKLENINYNENRSFRQRPSSVSENSPRLDIPSNNRQNVNGNQNYDRARQQNRRIQSNRQYSENGNIASPSAKPAQGTERQAVNRGRGQQTYQNIRTTARPTSEAYQITGKGQTQHQNGNNQFNKNIQQFNNYEQFNQQSTQNYNQFRNENEQQTTYKIKYNSPSTTQSTPQYSQQYDNNLKQGSQTYPENYNQFDKKATTKLNEKKTQYSAAKQTPSGFENYNKNVGKGNSQQTPAPKFNTNLLYDNNQQSTPDYYSPQVGQQQINNINKVQNQNSGSEASIVKNNQLVGKSTSFEQQPTIQPFTYNPGKNNYYNQPAYDKSKIQQQYSTVRPPTSVAYDQRYEPRSSTFSYKNKEYEDGQYRPEFYEREAGGEFDVSSKRSNVKKVFQEQKEAPEQEFLKTAHSINIAASGNKLAREQQQQQQQRLNAAARTASPRQQNYETKNYYGPSSTQSSSKINYSENQFQNYQISTTIAPFKVQHNNYENINRNNNYAQSSTAVPIKPQYDIRANSPSPSSTPSSFNNQQYNSVNTQRQNYYMPSSTSSPLNQYSESRDIQRTNVVQSTRQNTYDTTTTQPPKTQYTTASPRSVYSSFAAVTSEAPRPFSLRTDSPPVPQQSKKQIVSKTSASSPAKPIDLGKKKDVSYDYAYYDTSDHYSDYENIEEFRRTSKNKK